MIVALLALFVALGGSSYAALRVGSRQIVNNSIRGKDVRNGTLRGKDSGKNTYTGKQIKESALGKVPSAGSADSAASAASAGNAATLGGHGPSFFVPAGPAALRVVGAAGGGSFGPGWSSAGSSSIEDPGFWKDSSGTVHLEGAAGRDSGPGTVIFTLPPGYRPAKILYFITYGSIDTQAYVNIQADGEVVYDAGADATGFIDNTNFVGLSNIAFRATH
jgi:hypothetical protein